MRLVMRPRFLTYVGNDRGLLELLAHEFDSRTYRIEHCRIEDWAQRSLAPSWRCERVVLLDHFELPTAQHILGELSRCDAGVPVVVLIESWRRTRMTVAGAARLHGADRMVLKPIEDSASLRDAIEAAFRRLDHWRARFEQPCALENVVPVTEEIDRTGSIGAERSTAPSVSRGQNTDLLASC